MEKSKKRRPQVSEKCIGCWVCAVICDDVFEITDEWYAKSKKLDDYEGKWVDDAISACPVDAIKWIEI
jgi:ferredoxin